MVARFNELRCAAKLRGMYNCAPHARGRVRNTQRRRIPAAIVDFLHIEELMMKRWGTIGAISLFMAAGAAAQTAPPKAPEQVTVIQCGTLIDGRSNDVRHNVQI